MKRRGRDERKKKAWTLRWTMWEIVMCVCVFHECISQSIVIQFEKTCDLNRIYWNQSTTNRSASYSVCVCVSVVDLNYTAVSNIDKGHHFVIACCTLMILLHISRREVIFKWNPFNRIDVKMDFICERCASYFLMSDDICQMCYVSFCTIFSPFQFY